MKKFLLILWIITYALLRSVSPTLAVAESTPAECRGSESPSAECGGGASYACILEEDVYFYTTAQDTSGIFILPRTYYVKVLSVGEIYTQVEYLSDSEHTQALRGYCRSEQLTFVDYTPVNPYLYATFSVTYTAEEGWEDDELVGKIELNCAYYGSYSIGSKQYAYVLQNGRYVYVPYPADFSYAENPEFSERNSETAEEAESEGNGLRIGILTVLCLLVPILTAIILQSSKRPTYDAPDQEL